VVDGLSFNQNPQVMGAVNLGEPKGSRKNNFTFSSADASRLAALRKLEIS
jgi:hypothetical protein